VPRRARQLVADWLQVIGGLALLASLFLAWSHQYPAAVLAAPGMRAALAGVPQDATAWEVYSAADVLIALVAVALVLSGVVGIGRARTALVVVVALALGFTIHAASVAPTSGVDVIVPGQSHFVRELARSGPGETVAILALVGAMVGVALLSSKQHVRRTRRPAP
jgi:hypothetical protein